MAEPKWRELCRELVESLDERAWGISSPPSWTEVNNARAALSAAPDGPAVPTGREPASVAEELSDEELLELYQGPGTFSPVEFARAAIAADRARRFAPVVDDRGVLPMIVSETGADDEPELERIICASISGGADYVNNMPRELILERITPEGSIYASYIQANPDTPAIRPAPAAEGERRGTSYEDISRQLIKDLAAARDALEAWAEYLKEDGQPTAHRFCVKEYESAREAHTRACDAMAILRRPAPVAEGEVGELVAALRDRERWQHLTDAQVDRVADLLERQAAPVPVPVSERLPGAEDCDAEGRCWAWDWLAETWCLCDRTSACHGFDHWLPANALPLPSGEVGT